MRPRIVLLVAIVIAVVIGISAVLIAAPPVAPPPELAPSKTWRFGTIDPGSTGYKVAALLADYLRRGLPDYSLTVYPHVSTTANIKAFCEGQIESVYIADLGFNEVYERTGAFKDYTCKVMPVQTFWSFTMETFMLVPKFRVAEFKSWGDLANKPVFYTPAGYMNYINIMRALKILGIPANHIEIDKEMIADALHKGTILATALYTTARTTLPPWGKDAEIKIDLVGLNPTEAEAQALKAAGLSLVKIDVKKAFTKPGVVGELYGIPFYFGFHTNPKVLPEDTVYRWLKTLEANATELAKISPEFKPMSEDFAGFQAAAVRSSPQIPVHPGLAKYLKEKGLWQDGWIIAK